MWISSKFTFLRLIHFDTFRLEYLSILSQICPKFYETTLEKTKTYDNFTTEAENYAKTLRDIDGNDYLILNWKGYDGFNVYYITRTLTDVGYCQTFNLLNSTNIFKQNVLSPKYFNDLEFSEFPLDRSNRLWSLENGYAKDMSFKTYPLRSLDANANSGFQAEITTDSKNLTVPCERGTFGYKVVIHNPHEWPKVSKSHIQLSPNRKYNMVIKPQITKTSKSLKSYQPRE